MKKYDVLVIDDKDSIVERWGPKTAKSAEKCRNLLEQKIKKNNGKQRVQLIERAD